MIGQVVKNLIQQLGLTEILLPFRTPDDNFTAFLKQSSIGRLESELASIIRGHGFGYYPKNTSLLTLHNQNSDIVGILGYDLTISDELFLDKLMVPDPEGRDGQAFEHHTGLIRCDRGFLDDVVGLLQSHGLSANPVRTAEDTFQTLGMRAYYPILEQYQRRYENSHSV